MTYLRPRIQAIDATTEAAACCTPTTYQVAFVTLRGKCDTTIPDEVIIEPLGGQPITAEGIVEAVTEPIPCFVTIDGACLLP